MNSTTPNFNDNFTPSPATSSAESYQQNILGLTLWSLLYACLVLIGVFGNIGICWIILSRKKMNTVTNLFLSSTAFADCNVILLNTIFNFTYALHRNEWLFGAGFCHFVNFIPAAAVCASVFSITVISIDRLMLVTFPMRQRISKRKAKLIIASIWLTSLIIVFPQTYLAVTKVEEKRTVCYIDWPNNLKFSYHFCFMLLTYWFPLAVLATAYIFMVVRLKSKKNNQCLGENATMIRKQMKNRQTVSMMILVVITFAICYFPYQLYFLLVSFRPQLADWKGMQQIYLAVFWLAMSHAMYNPIIYCWANPRFRMEFLNLLESNSRKPSNAGLANYSRGTMSNRSLTESRNMNSTSFTIF